MPKQKTHKGMAKRFKLTATGKVKYKRSFAGHLMSSKSGNRVRQLRKATYLQGAIADKIREQLGG